VIVDTSGRPVGRHSGTFRFTIGQRRGVGVAYSEPLYVVGIDAERQKVVVGSRAETAVGAVRIDGVVHHRDWEGGPLTVQVRSYGGVFGARLDMQDAPGTIELLEPAFGVATGQTAVVYEGEGVVLAGSIVGTAPWAWERVSSRGPE
jgi:tRNA-specific 2-thiouridylase